MFASDNVNSSTCVIRRSMYSMMTRIDILHWLAPTSSAKVAHSYSLPSILIIFILTYWFCLFQEMCRLAFDFSLYYGTSRCIQQTMTLCSCMVKLQVNISRTLNVHNYLHS